jgi:hypothetical protein
MPTAIRIVYRPRAFLQCKAVSGDAQCAAERAGPWHAHDGSPSLPRPTLNLASAGGPSKMRLPTEHPIEESKRHRESLSESLSADLIELDLPNGEHLQR